MTVQNDSGNSDIFNIGESVKQGTVWAAPICANFIDKGFREIEMAKTNGISYGNIKIPHLLYQDDILLMSVNETTMQKMLDIAEDFQDRNLLRFDDKKSQLMCMRYSRKIPEKNSLKLNGDKLPTTTKYKYLGDVKNYKGHLEETINDRCQKWLRITNEITCLTKNPTLKQHKIEVGLKIINMILIPKLLYGCETWTGMTKEQLSKLEKVQKDVLTKLFALPRTTPLCVLLFECGILPIEHKIKIRKLVYWHKILNLDAKRLVKAIYDEQKRMGLKNCWYSEICSISFELGIHLSETEISSLKEKEWVKIVNEKVIEEMNSANKTNQNTKLRLIRKSSFGLKNYLKNSKLAPKLLSIKLNMTELRANYKGKSVACWGSFSKGGKM